MRLCSLHFNYGIFPDGHFKGTGRHPAALKCLTISPEKSRRPAVPSPAFVPDEIFTMHRAEPTRFRDAEELWDQEVEMAKELLVIGSVAHIFKGVLPRRRDC